MIKCRLLVQLRLFNSYTMAARDFADIYTQSPRAAGVCQQNRGISDIYHLGCTHLIGERTNDHLFYTVASENRSWF